MDGTLLDLNFDLYFWLEYLPLAFAKKHHISHQQAKDKILPLLESEAGKLHWYCLDYWQKTLNLDIVQLKKEVAHLIQVHPFVLNFLSRARQQKKRIFLITNAHPKAISLKMSHTQLTHYFDRIISSHQYGFAKEEQNFWKKLQTDINFNKQTCAFFDDSLAVLTSAKEYGIKQVIAINKPSSKKPILPIKNFINIENFKQILLNN
jgi:putative hydrolase of the HAD superfamily